VRTPPLILIVDDEPTNLEILQTRLVAHDYEILTATDGEAGLAIAREKQPDLILLDIMMPKMDGIEVCRHLRADSSLPFMPIIMVTAKADSKDVVAGLEAGGDEYLAKPVDHAALVARVKSMLVDWKPNRLSLRSGTGRSRNGFRSNSPNWSEWGG